MKIKKSFSIAFFLPSLEPGGTERNVVNLINNIDRKKHILSLVLGKAEGDFIKEINRDIPIINLGASSSLGLFLKLVKYFRKEKIDIFVSAFPRINIICISAIIFSRAKTKIVATEHSLFSFLPIIAKTRWRRIFARFFLPAIGKIIYPQADLIVCVSKGIAEDFVKTVGCKEKVKIIYNPVINDKIYELAEERISHSWFSDFEIPIIVAVGRLVECKDYPTLFRAFSLIAKKQNVRFVILGKGPEEHKLKQLAMELGLSENIAFLGFQANPYKYMKRASVFVLSSLQEGFGNVIVEAMACGTPVVATDCKSGPGEIIQDGINGLLVPPQDAKALAEAILKILDDPVLAKQFSDKGKIRAENFSIKKSVEEYEKVFEILSEKNG